MLGQIEDDTLVVDNKLQSLVQDMSINATDKEARIKESGAHSLSPSCPLKFQLYLAILGGVGRQCFPSTQLSDSALKGHTWSLQFRSLNKVCDMGLRTVKNYHIIM